MAFFILPEIPQSYTVAAVWDCGIWDSVVWDREFSGRMTTNLFTLFYILDFCVEKPRDLCIETRDNGTPGTDMIEKRECPTQHKFENPRSSFCVQIPDDVVPLQRENSC